MSAENPLRVLHRSVNLQTLAIAAWGPRAFSVGSAWFAIAEFRYSAVHHSQLAQRLGLFGALCTMLGISLWILANAFLSFVAATMENERRRVSEYEDAWLRLQATNQHER